jgi:ubiquinone/menaquinone biosynthesis C-methylase UbiE
MIAFGVLERLGEHGRVVFADISKDLLEHSRTLAEVKSVADRCEFVLAPATDLSRNADGSVDVVTTRSVLIYLGDKRLEELFTRLRDAGVFRIFLAWRKCHVEADSRCRDRSSQKRRPSRRRRPPASLQRWV